MFFEFNRVCMYSCVACKCISVCVDWKVSIRRHPFLCRLHDLTGSAIASRPFWITKGLTVRNDCCSSVLEIIKYRGTLFSGSDSIFLFSPLGRVVFCILPKAVVGLGTFLWDWVPASGRVSLPKASESWLNCRKKNICVTEEGCQPILQPPKLEDQGLVLAQRSSSISGTDLYLLCYFNYINYLCTVY